MWRRTAPAAHYSVPEPSKRGVVVVHVKDMSATTVTLATIGKHPALRGIA
jgi:hypothetical protein